MKTTVIAIAAGALSMHNDAISAATAGTWITSPIWMNFVAPAYQVVLAFLGFVLLVLTIRNKWLDLKIKRATLAEINGDDEDTNEVIGNDG